jgi:hypothetical protein
LDVHSKKKNVSRYNKPDKCRRHFNPDTHESLIINVIFYKVINFKMLYMSFQYFNIDVIGCSTVTTATYVYQDNTQW